MTYGGWFRAWPTVAVALALALPAGAARQIALVENGRSSYSICVAADASPSEKRGAQELQRFLEEMSGARLPIVTDAADPAAGLVLVGRSRLTDRLKLDIPFDTLGPEGFVLKTVGQHLAVVGGRERGTMYGVYTLLEKLGCRWFSPGVSRIPKKRTIALGPLNETHRPAFEYREPFFTEAFDKDWAARNKMNGAHLALDETTGGKIQYYPFVHSFYQLISPAKYFKDHPEYFSLIDGQRRVERGQLCLTNPDVLRLAVEAVLEWIRTHPEARIYSVSQNDWEGWCECDNCRRAEQEEGGAHSGPILRFVNALAAEIEKKHPDKLIDTLAYWYSEAPPARVRPRPNVRVRLCPIGACQAHPYQQCPYNAYFMKNLRAWSQITSQLYVWHYNTNFTNYLLPFPDFDELAADIPMYRRHGVVGLFMEGAYAKGGGGENAELRSYVMARLLWDTNAAVRRAIDEFHQGYYGKAARPMRAYFDLLHGLVRRPRPGQGQHIWIFATPDYPDNFLRGARDLFRQAEAAADDAAVRARIEKARLPIDYIELLRAKKFAVRDGWYAPADMNSLKARFDNLLAAARRFGITRLHESAELADDEREFARFIQPYRVVTIQNASLRVDVVPELGGRVIRILDRKTGKDLLRRTEPGERGYPNVGGLVASVYNDFHGRALTVNWKVDSAQGSGELVLSGTCENGLRFRRTLRLPGDEPRLQTETVAENAGGSPLPAVLQSRIDADPGDIEQAAVEFRKQAGGLYSRKLIRPEEQPSGSETLTGADRSDGERRVVGRGRVVLLRERVSPERAARAFFSWTAKGPHRVTLGVWSQPKTLAPGERLALQADYFAGPR